MLKVLQDLLGKTVTVVLEISGERFSGEVTLVNETVLELSSSTWVAVESIAVVMRSR